MSLVRLDYKFDWILYTLYCANIDEPQGPTAFTGSAQLYRRCRCGHEKRGDSAEPPAAQYVG